MSIEIDLKDADLAENRLLNVHFIPASIKADVEVDIEKYFENYTEENCGFLKNSLRGYPFYGEKNQIPEDFQGLVFQETQKSIHDGSKRIFKTTGHFKEFTYWNYDKYPNKNDIYQQSLEWLPLAENLAQPVTEDELENELKLLLAQKDKK